MAMNGANGGHAFLGVPVGRSATNQVHGTPGPSEEIGRNAQGGGITCLPTAKVDSCSCRVINCRRDIYAIVSTGLHALTVPAAGS